MFGELGLDAVKRLCAYAKIRKIKRGTTIFAKGDPGSALFAVRSGTVKISVPAADGREAVFNVLNDGEVFGEIALLDGRSRTADAIALTECELMVIDRRDFLAFMQSEPKVALRLIELLCARLRFASEHLEEMVFLALPARLARTLLRLVRDQTEWEPVSRTQVGYSRLGQYISADLGYTRDRYHALNQKAEARTADKSTQSAQARLLSAKPASTFADRAVAGRGGLPAKNRKIVITQYEISQIVGMTRESTNKQLRVWAKRKWVRLERGGIIVLEPGKLAAAGADTGDKR
jgi:CRP-like cAMP-binding protein